jgi:hypothetical protein
MLKDNATDRASSIVEEFGTMTEATVTPKKPPKKPFLAGKKDDQILGEETWPGKARTRDMLAKARAEYELPPEADVKGSNVRACHFIAWAAWRWPKVFLPLPLIASVLQRSDTVVGETTAPVKALKAQIGSYKGRMREDHEKELCVALGCVRGSTDLADVIKNFWPRQQKRKEITDSATKSMLKSNGLDSPATIDKAVKEGVLDEEQGRRLKVAIAGLYLSMGDAEKK